MKKLTLCFLFVVSALCMQSQIAFVNSAASGLNDGTSWANAYTDLQTAITNASSGSIWVVAGTYYPGASGNNAASFSLKNNVQILGGFNGTEGGPTQRDPAVNVTILSGDLNQSTTFDGSDAYHVVISYNEDSTAVLDGFTISGGNAVGGNIWDFSGGGFSHQPTGSGALNPIVRNCIFTGNNANQGTAIAVVNWNVPSSNVRTQIINCKLINDINVGGGVIFTECQGSGSYISSKFENVLIANNTSASGTTALFIEHANGGRSDVQFIGCTIANNTTSGDVIYYRTYGGPGTLNFKNCILQDANLFTDGTLYADNSNVYNVGYYIGSNNISSDPLFVNPGSGDFHLQCASPSINFGENSFTNEVKDLENNNRITGIIDMGVYESNYTMPTVLPNATPSSSICIGDNVTLSGSGAISYTWTGGVIDGSPFTPGFTDTYTVTGTDANGCVNTASITVTVNPLPLISIGYSANIVCLGSPVTLYGIGGVNYAWTHGVSDNIPFSPTTTETYTVTGVDANGCQAIDQISVTVEDPTTLSAGSDYDICSTSTGFLMNGNDGGFANAFWSTAGDGLYDDANLISGSIYTFGPVDLSSPTVSLVLMATPAVCPVISDTMIITRHDAPTANILSSGDMCSNVGNVMLTANSVYASSLIWTSTGTGNFSSPTSTSTFYGPSPAEYAAGIARLAFKAIANSPYCPDAEDSLIIQIHSAPNPTVWSSYNICQGDSFLLGFNSPGGTAPFTYQWTNSLAAVISTANTDYITPTATDSYTYTVTDAFGCTASFFTTLNYDASEVISGTMNVGAGTLSDGVIYILKYEAQQLAFDTFLIYPFSAGTGGYSFPSMPHGNYLVKVVPDSIIFPNLLPTYYGDAFQWDSATVITHNCTSPFVADINIIQLLGGTGTGTVSGFIKEGNGFGTRLIHNPDEIFVPGGPLKGVDVKLGKNPGGGIQARTMSDSTGFYEFSNLPDDSYRIYVDIPGLPMDSFYIVNVQADSTIDLDYYADSNSVFPILPTAVGIHIYTSATTSFDIYPNPAHGNTSIAFELSSSHTASIRLMDITGKQVMNIQLNKLPKGKHEYQLNFANQHLSSGIYFVEVMSDGKREIKKIVVEY